MGESDIHGEIRGGNAAAERPLRDASVGRVGDSSFGAGGSSTADAVPARVEQFPPELSVLVVSSDESLRESVLAHLSATGYKTRAGAQLTDPGVADAEPDVFVLDTAGDHEPGVGWCNELHQRAQTGRHPYLIVINVPESPESVPVFLQAGADDVLVAPFQAERLRRRLLVADWRLRNDEERVGRLGEAEARLKVFVDQNPEAMLLSDANGRFVEVNERACDLLGYGRNELLGLALADLIAPESRAPIPVKVGEPLFSFEHLLRRKDETRVPVEVRAGRMPDRRIFFFLHDITERKARERALHESEQRFRAIYEQAPLGVALIDTQRRRFTLVNQKYCEIVGRTPEEMAQLDLRNVTHPEDLPIDLEQMESLIEGKIRGYHREKRYLRPDGRTAWVSLTVVPMWNANEPATFHMAIAEDITQRKLAEETAHGALVQLQTILDEASDGIIVVSARGTIESLNPAAAAMFGYEADDLVSQQVGVLVSPAEDGTQSGLRTANGAGGFADFTGARSILIGKRSDGSTFPIELTVNEMVIGSERKFSAILRDITERDAADRALRKTEARYRALVEMSPVAMVVHRLGSVLFANDALARLLNVDDPGTLVGRRVEEFTHPDSLANVQARITEIARTGTSSLPPLEERLLRATGESFLAEVSVVEAIFDGQSANLVVVGDISAR